jgi:hypothetical protein
MNPIDQSIAALVAYLGISLVASYLCSCRSTPIEAKASASASIIPEGKEAYCLVCSRSFQNDATFEQHRQSRAHSEKLEKHRGDEYRIQKHK